MIIGDSAFSQLTRSRLPFWGETGAPLWISGPKGSGRSHLAAQIHAASNQERFTVFDGDWSMLGGQDRTVLFPVGIRWLLSEGKQLGLLYLKGAIQARVIVTSEVSAEVLERHSVNPGLLKLAQLFPITVPPLRLRTGDIEPLAVHLGGMDLGPGVLEVLIHHPWPGNIRELKEVMTFAAKHSQHDGRKSVKTMDLPPGLRTRQSGVYNLGLQSLNRDDALAALYELALAENAGNVAKAARALGVNRNTLINYKRRKDERRNDNPERITGETKDTTA